MIKVITPDQFKKVPWKNGKGTTIELVISPGGTINDFDWRISQAKVVENGVFSDFTGYYRHLVLLQGTGLELNHGHSVFHQLDSPLSVSAFNGACTTVATLKAGPISDFNIMTKNTTCSALIFTSIMHKHIKLIPCKYCFVYCLSGTSKLIHQEDDSMYLLPAGHLLQMEEELMENWIISGEQLIVVFLSPK